MSNKKGSTLIVILLAIIIVCLVIIGLVMFLDYNSNKNLSNNNQSQQNLNNNSVPIPVTTKSVSNVPSDLGAKAPAIINCNNAECFLQAAQTCTPAKGIVTYDDVPFLNVLYSDKIETQIKKGDNGMCIYYQKMLSYSIKFSDQMIQMILGQGKTMAQIETMQKETNQTFLRLTVGRDSTCLLTTADLVKKIDASISTKGAFDFSSKKPGCTGLLYNAT